MSAAPAFKAMEFISNSASTIYTFYTTARRRIALDAIVERLVNNVVANARVFIGNLSKLEPDVVVMDSALAAFDEWMSTSFKVYDRDAGTTNDSRDLTAVRRRMLSRRLVKLKSTFLETVKNIARPQNKAAPRLINALMETLVCPICLVLFGDTDPTRIPRFCVDCGQTVCTDCWEGILASKHNLCPFCRSGIDPERRAINLPRNVCLLDLIAATRAETGVAATSSATSPTAAAAVPAEASTTAASKTPTSAGTANV